MADKNNFTLGEQILNAVDDILASGDFDKLNSVVSSTVSKALEETRKQLDLVSKGGVQGTGTGSSRRSVAGTTTSSTATGRTAANGAGPARTASSSNGTGKAVSHTGGKYSQEYVLQNSTDRFFAPAKNRVKRVGNVSGVLQCVFGGIGMGIFGIFGLVLGIGALTVGASSALAGVMGLLFAASFGMTLNGASKNTRLKRAERYVELMQGKTYINLKELALLTNKSTGYVRRDLKKMIRAGIFPEGHLDLQEQSFLLGDVAYREYLRLEKSRRALQIEEEERRRIEEREEKDRKLLEARAERDAKRKRRAAEEQAKNAQTESTLADDGQGGQAGDISDELLLKNNPELYAMITEGNECIQKLQRLNDAIEGEVISNKLFELEKLLKEIFEQIKGHPEQMPEMHKFMDYYLPTTLKLVTAYEEFDHVSVPGEDILSAKAEIEKTLDTINTAFAELLNKLFRARAFDVATDAQVLSSMLEREGLTKQMQIMQEK